VANAKNSLTKKECEIKSISTINREKARKSVTLTETNEKISWRAHRPGGFRLVSEWINLFNITISRRRMSR